MGLFTPIISFLSNNPTTHFRSREPDNTASTGLAEGNQASDQVLQRVTLLQFQQTLSGIDCINIGIKLRFQEHRLFTQLGRSTR